MYAVKVPNKSKLIDNLLSELINSKQKQVQMKNNKNKENI